MIICSRHLCPPPELERSPVRVLLDPSPVLRFVGQAYIRLPVCGVARVGRCPLYSGGVESIARPVVAALPAGASCWVVT